MMELLDMLQVQNPLKNQMIEKEKQQIIDAFCVGRDNSVDYFEPYTKNLEEVNYYNQTFKQD